MSGECAERGDGGKAVGGAAEVCQTAHFRADAEAVHPTRSGAKGGVVQDEAVIAPFVGAMIADLSRCDREMRGLGGAEEGGDFGVHGGCAIR